MRSPLVRRRRAADGVAHRLMQAPRSPPPKRVVAHSRHQACVAAALSSINATLPSYLCQAEGGCCANRTCSHSGGRSVPVCSLGPIPPIRLLASHSIAVNKLVCPLTSGVAVFTSACWAGRQLRARDCTPRGSADPSKGARHWLGALRFCRLPQKAVEYARQEARKSPHAVPHLPLRSDRCRSPPKRRWRAGLFLVRKGLRRERDDSR
jgi:hypothetical protein